MEKYYILKSFDKGVLDVEEYYDDYIEASENFNELIKVNMYSDFVKIELTRVEDNGAVETYIRQCTLSYNNDERY